MRNSFPAMLRTRLFLGLMPLALLLIGTGGYAIHICRQIAGAMQHDLVVNYRSVIAGQQMRDTARTMASALASAGRDPIGAQRLFDENRAIFNRLLMEESGRSAGTTRMTLTDALDGEFSKFAALTDPSLQVGESRSLEAMHERESALYAVLNAIENVTRFDFATARQIEASAERLATNTQRVLIAVMVTAFAFWLFVVWQLAASLLQPIRALTQSAVAVGEGDLDRTVPEFSRDELGQLARAFNTMAEKLRAYRTATAERVIRTQRTMEATLTSTPDPVFVVGEDGEREALNPSAAELARLPEFAEGFPPALAEPLASVMSSGNHYLPTDYARAITVRIGTEPRYYLPRMLAIGDKLTEFRGVAVILQDVTKFRLLDDAKTNLVGTVSHELKTPLTSLRMAVHLLLEARTGALSAQQQDLLEDARNDSERLLRMLDNLLDLARLEAGMNTLDRREIEIGQLVDEVAVETRGHLGDHRLVTQIPPELRPHRINVDVERLHHVFMNLLTNAAKYSPPGGTIDLGVKRTADGFVCFSVRDQGPGIPPESIGRVFDRFYRAPGQTKSGAGLGLAIAREIVVAHGGSISCTSTPGKGTEFFFLLPG